MLGSILNKPTPSHREFMSQMSILALANTRKEHAQHLTTIRDYPPDEVFSKVRTDDERVPFEVDGNTYYVKMNSQRYFLFRRQRSCASCGLEGTIVSLETMPDGSYPHFNLYGFEDGERILFTKDHIKPKAYGGTDTMDNYAALCAPCNQLKASFDLSYASVAELRELARNKNRWSRKELNRRIQERRLLLQNCLNGQ